MALPTTGSFARKIENLQIGGGYNDIKDGGLDIDQTGNIATNGDLTVSGTGGSSFTGNVSFKDLTISAASGIVRFAQKVAGLAYIDLDPDATNGVSGEKLRFFRNSTPTTGTARLEVFSPGTSTETFGIDPQTGDTRVGGSLEIDGTNKLIAPFIGAQAMSLAATSPAGAPWPFKCSRQVTPKFQ